jgi:gas vesicle protein
MYGAETYTNEGTYETRGNDFMIGLLCGTAVGAAIGLLLAPKTGAELRTQLADSAERIRRRTADTYEQASGAMTDMVDKGKKAVRRGREKFEETRSDFSNETTGAGATSAGSTTGSLGGNQY